MNDVQVKSGFYKDQQGEVIKVDGNIITVRLELHGDVVEFLQDDLIVIL